MHVRRKPEDNLQELAVSAHFVGIELRLSELVASPGTVLFDGGF